MLQVIVSFFIFSVSCMLLSNCKQYQVISTLDSMLSFGSGIYASDNDKFKLTREGVSMAPFDNELNPIWTFSSHEYVNWNDNDEVSAFELRDDGNLILYFRNGHEYESFSYPGNILLPNQTLKTGMTLTSGRFTATVDYDGISIHDYKNHNSEVWMLGRDCNSSMTTEVHYTGTELMFSNGCHNFSVRTSNTSRPVFKPYLLLDPASGEFVSHNFDASQSKDTRTAYEYAANSESFMRFKSQNDSCNEEERGACEMYMFTISCTCLTPSGSDDLYTRSDNIGYLSRGGNYEFFASDYSYMPNETQLVYKDASRLQLVFYSPSTLVLTFDACKDRCFVQNATKCLGFFYDRIGSHCFFMPGNIYHNATFSIIGYDSLSNQFDPAVLVLLIPTTVLIAWIVAIIMFAVVRQRFNFDPRREIEDMLSSMQGLPQRFSYTSLDTATRGFSDKLGSGGYGSVYKGVLYDGKSVAVKKLDTTAGPQGAKQFVTEVAGMGGISHINVLKLCGFCIEATTTQCLLVYDLMLNGSLDKWLFESEKQQAYLTWQQRIDIALATAQGLHYLHEECSEPILHLDIKPQNILLDEKFTAKLADFGMAKMLENRDITQVHTCMRGTPGYMAPEWLTHFTATKKCDVFSYGMVLLEIIGGRKNVDLSKLNINNDEKLDEDVKDGGWYFPAWVVKQVNKGNLLAVVDYKVRESASEKCQQVKMIVHLALWCIQGNPSTRPSMQTVVQVLQGHLELGPAPPSLTLSDTSSMVSWTSQSYRRTSSSTILSLEV